MGNVHSRLVATVLQMHTSADRRLKNNKKRPVKKG